MPVDLLLLAASLALGITLQRRPGGADRLRRRLWDANYVVLLPIAATYAFLGLRLDGALLAIIGCAVFAWWLTVGLAGAWAQLAARTPRERGATWLTGAFPNTGFLGFPLAHLVFGAEGLRLAIVYDQVSLVVPQIVVATIIARRHAVDADGAADADRSIMRQALTSPPMLAVLVLVALRLTLLPDPVELAWLGDAVAAVVGPVGFLLLGMSVPLGGFGHERSTVVAASGAVVVRIVAAPALLWLVALVTGVSMPGAIYLSAAMPTAFLTVVVSRLHGLDGAIVRTGLVLSTVLMVGATMAWVATGGIG